MNTILTYRCVLSQEETNAYCFVNKVNWSDVSDVDKYMYYMDLYGDAFSENFDWIVTEEEEV